MGLLKDHLATSTALAKVVDEYNEAEDWPIVIDAAFYMVYHLVEAVHALECRDTTTFADGFHLLEKVLRPQGISEQFVSQIEYLFYFRRGTIYGPHFPTEAQVRRYVDIAKGLLTEARAFFDLRQSEAAV